MQWLWTVPWTAEGAIKHRSEARGTTYTFQAIAKRFEGVCQGSREYLRAPSGPAGAPLVYAPAFLHRDPAKNAENRFYLVALTVLRGALAYFAAAARAAFQAALSSTGPVGRYFGGFLA